MDEFTKVKARKIALIAHDNMKLDLINWAYKNKCILENHTLCGTESTAILLEEKIGLDVKKYESGMMGGDQQISTCIVNGEVDFMIYFWDPLTSQPHDSDIKALLRIAVLYNIPVAMNKSSADCILNSNIIKAY
ncbi:methylglyoxal synthase [Clostridium gasigenes]|uniref:Methylglyoxal synthase n=1 Tax=Clostridium gasigenes TaxID=94869 RepID=A0A1H0MF61_9CLOT|nr:methylglyoxal synthase [Clostridium gasigenes]MBB6713717.1 methylglyoxal synthase [Clostridium gasigenes]SDO79073.1 methylglyoxal synthase [Clostridium gasigenes]